MLDGAARLPDLMQQAADMGMPAIAMTDHGNLFGAYDFYKAAHAAGIKPIIGLEGYYAPQGRFERRPFDFGGGFDEGTPEDPGAGRGKFSYTHMTLWAESTEGMHNLFRLSSLASLEGQYHKPRFDRELMERYAGGLIGTTGCPSGEVNRWLQAGEFDKARAAAADMRDILGSGNYFCELMDHGLASSGVSGRTCYASRASSTCRSSPPTMSTTCTRATRRPTMSCCVSERGQPWMIRADSDSTRATST
jgi:DNA polymerase-3 subunit alpha